MLSLDSSLEGQLEELAASGNLRTLKNFTPMGAVEARIATEPGPDTVLGPLLTLFASNDYLGLAHHPRVIEAATEALRRMGTGSGASRLVTGTSELSVSFEEEIAAHKHSEAALIFPTGYQANVGVVSTLASRDDCLIMDRLAHASLIDGAKLSGAAIQRFRHNDLADLERQLSLRAARDARHRFIITEGLFSMDGDIPPLADILDIALENEATVILDDAHATGVLGRQGRGSIVHLGLENHPIVAGGRLITLGTLSKALGSLGGFVAAKKLVIDHMIALSRPFIFTTALSPASLGAAQTSLAILHEDEGRELLGRLEDNALRLRRALGNAGFRLVGDEVSPIIPVVIGASEAAVEYSRQLLVRGFFVPAIRPPAVPKNGARLRITVSAAHSDEQIDSLVAAMVEIGAPGQ